MKAILDHFGIDEKFTAPVQKPKFFNKIKDNVPLIKDYNQMADILYLPTTNSPILTPIFSANFSGVITIQSAEIIPFLISISKFIGPFIRPDCGAYSL